MLVQAQIVALLNELLNQTAKMRKGGLQAVYFCPECKHYKRKLEVNLETGQWHCWTCNIKGSFLGSLLTKLKASATYRDQMAVLTGDLRIAQRRKPTQETNEVILPEEFHPLSKPISSIEYRNALAYVKRRGVLREDILRYNIGYCESGEYEYHIVIPSYDALGKLNFFIGRRYYDSEGTIPYKKPPCPMDNIIGFESFVNWNEPINMCEGVFDAFAVRNNAVPLFGKYPSKKLCEQMVLNGTKQANLILDDDALRDSVRNYELFKRRIPNIEVHIISLSGKDPSALGFIKTHEFIRNSEPFTDSDLLAYEMNL